MDSKVQWARWHPQYPIVRANLEVWLKDPSNHGFLVLGERGTGKTTLVEGILQALGQRYIRVANATPEGIIMACVKHKDAVIVLDDVDLSVLTKPKMLTLLKILLDTSEVRRVSWQTLAMSKRLKEYADSDEMIELTNKVIIITNEDVAKWTASEKTHALLQRFGNNVIEVRLSPAEIIELAKLRWGVGFVEGVRKLTKALSGDSDAVFLALVKEQGLRGLGQIYARITSGLHETTILLSLMPVFEQIRTIKTIMEAKSYEEAKEKMPRLSKYAYRHYKMVAEQIKRAKRWGKVSNKVKAVVRELIAEVSDTYKDI